MKKIAITILSAIALCGVVHAVPTTLAIDTMGPNIPIFLADDTTLVSTLEGGYIATYWYSATNDEADLVAIGAGVFGDAYALAMGLDATEALAWAGTLFWNSYPTNVINMNDGQEYLFSIRVFQAPSLAALYDGNENASLHLGSSEIAGLWSAASTGGSSGQIGDFQYHMMPAPGGVPVTIGETNFAGGSLHQVGAPVPEPSTWLLLGAGAAIVVIFRRRKNA